MEAFNKLEQLKPIDGQKKVDWVTENTAMLIVHGIGNQLPLETLDEFGRGLVKQYHERFQARFEISHEIVVKQGDGNEKWFDNALRLRMKGSPYFIDLYEYYWADYTQDKASWRDMSQWLNGVVNGAEKFYKQNGDIVVTYDRSSIFFNRKTKKFRAGRYRLFLFIIGRFFLVVDGIYRGLLWLLGRIPIPLLGNAVASLFKSYTDSQLHDVTNIISEVCIYNVTDPKNKWYCVRRTILDGAVNAVRFLIERDGPDGGVYYPSVIICAHSLGTQIAYDAINKVDLLVNEGLIRHYNRQGMMDGAEGATIARQLRGFVTFGSPLDKVVFFLRENVETKDYIWRQFLSDYHHFKMRNLDLDEGEDPDRMTASCNLKSFLQSIQWRNYFDRKDYVSGNLDLYDNLTNVDCHFIAGRLGFTHSRYWVCADFYNDIITHFLQP